MLSCCYKPKRVLTICSGSHSKITKLLKINIMHKTKYINITVSSYVNKLYKLLTLGLCIFIVQKLILYN